MIITVESTECVRKVLSSCMGERWSERENQNSKDIYRGSRGTNEVEFRTLNTIITERKNEVKGVSQSVVHDN